MIEINRMADTHWPRYFLVSQAEGNTRFWTGEEWTDDFAAARLFAFLPEVCREFERLQEQARPNNRVREFQATVTVKLRSGRPISPLELARFLNQFAELFLPTDGPTDDSLVQAAIHWHELQELPIRKDEG